MKVVLILPRKSFVAEIILRFILPVKIPHQFLPTESLVKLILPLYFIRTICEIFYEIIKAFPAAK